MVYVLLIWVGLIYIGEARTFVIAVAVTVFILVSLAFYDE